jgi:hypothetical protein
LRAQQVFSKAGKPLLRLQLVGARTQVEVKDGRTGDPGDRETGVSRSGGGGAVSKRVCLFLGKVLPKGSETRRGYAERTRPLLS